ncbi:MAG: hypothetical protein DRH56_06475 [Deltaproteobacteria bacterium]|nr:MAG: hypothetical protein DRH56_06475 [Deltaproteobacteria bacterium]
MPPGWVVPGDYFFFAFRAAGFFFAAVFFAAVFLAVAFLAGFFFAAVFFAAAFLALASAAFARVSCVSSFLIRAFVAVTSLLARVKVFLASRNLN